MVSVDVLIAGAGPAGLAAAHALLVARPGTRVAVMERTAPRPRGAVVGVPPNGVRALEAIGPELRAAVGAHHLGARTFMRFNPSGELVSVDEGWGSGGKVQAFGDSLSLPWWQLQGELARALPAGVLRSGHRFLGFAEREGGVEAQFDTPQGTLTVEAALLIGADGGQSDVRQALLGDGPPDFLGTAIWRAVRPRPDSWPLEEGWVSWSGPPGSGQPNLLTTTLPGGLVCWQLFKRWPAERLEEIGGGRRTYVQAGPPPAEEAAARLARALQAVEGFPPEVQELIGGTDPAAITEHGQFAREAEACQVYARGRVALVGDAAHLGTPMLAQGCSQGIEDALELGRAVGQLGPTPEALQAYQQIRVPLAGAVQRASLEVYRDFVSGKGGSEVETNIREGFLARQFEPLRAPAAAGAPAAC